MQLFDALTLDTRKVTKDGYLAVRAKAARTGVYQYTGAQVDPDNKHGLRDAGLVNVLRDASTVFDRAAVQSFIGKPVTDDHPADSVTADNWSSNARGVIMGALKDGDYLAFDLLLTDAGLIDKVNGGKRELSNGYTADLEFGDFVAADGTKCPVRQSKITSGNHVAVVDRGRAGPDCKISDSFAVCDVNPGALPDIQKETPAMATIIVDGLPVSLADEAAVRAVLDKKDAAITTANEALAASDAKVGTLTAEKAALEKQVADAKAELEPAALERRVADRATMVGQAKALKSDIVTDGKSADVIRSEIVTAELGDAAKDFTPEQFAAAFAVIAKGAKTDTLADSVKGGIETIADAATREQEAWRKGSDHNAWRNQA